MISLYNHSTQRERQSKQVTLFDYGLEIVDAMQLKLNELNDLELEQEDYYDERSGIQTPIR